MKKFTLFFLAICIIFTLTSASQAGTQPKITKAQLSELVTIKYQLEGIAQMQKEGILTNELGEQCNQYLLQRALIIVGKPVNQQELLTLIQSLSVEDSAAKSLLGKAKGYITLANILKVASAILIVLGACWLFGIYFLAILMAIPKVVYELLVYAACIGLIAGGKIYFNGEISTFFPLLGCLGLIGALGLTHALHSEEMEDFYESAGVNEMSFNTGILFLVWAATAVLYQNAIIGFFSILALEACLGFSIAVTPLCYFIGFDEESSIPRAMGASLILIVVYSFFRITGITPAHFDIFSKGALFIGTFVYFIGLLIISSKWYGEGNSYLLCQLLAIASGVAAVVVGSLYNLPQLQQIGGTLFAIYLIEKYIEIPFEEHWAWMIFGLGWILFGAYYIMIHYPKWFLFV